MPAPMLIAAVTVVLCISAVAADDRDGLCQSTPIPILEAFQTAFDKNVAFWTDLPYTTMPKPARPATDIQGEYVVLLRVFIDIYMNKLRPERCSSPLADFVATLPALGGEEQLPRALHAGLLEIIGSILQPNDTTSPSIVTPLKAAKVVLDVFGSTVRAALYSDDNLLSWRSASFVSKYVDIMASYKLPSQVALAVLARDLVLADDNTPTEKQVQEAAAALQRFVVVLDQKPTLSEALELLSGLTGRKFQSEGVDEMAPQVYLDLLVAGLGRGHDALRAFCIGRADRFHRLIGVRMAVNLEQILFLLVVSGQVDVISIVIPWVGRQPFHHLGFLPYLALFWDRNRALLEAAAALKIVPFESRVVSGAIGETINNLNGSTWWQLDREKVPALVLFDEIRKLVADRLSDSIDWPHNWPAVAPQS